MQQIGKSPSNTRLDALPALKHPVHVVLLVSALPLFLGALFADWAYFTSYETQWINFASWLNVGALVFLGFALLWTMIEALRADGPRGRGKWIFLALVGVTFLIGFINALVHAKDAWATMPAGLVLSAITLVMVAAAIWYGFARQHREEVA